MSAHIWEQRERERKQRERLYQEQIIVLNFSSLFSPSSPPHLPLLVFYNNYYFTLLSHNTNKPIVKTFIYQLRISPSQ
jgi:hypothetical protein